MVLNRSTRILVALVQNLDDGVACCFMDANATVAISVLVTASCGMMSAKCTMTAEYVLRSGGRFFRSEREMSV
jgi:hypothetical protein